MAFFDLICGREVSGPGIGVLEVLRDTECSVVIKEPKSTDYFRTGVYLTPERLYDFADFVEGLPPHALVYLMDDDMVIP